NLLISIDEAPQSLSIKMAVSVCDQGEGKSVNARIVFERTVGEFRQFVVVTLRQILANLAHLLFDYMKIVDQPFGGGRDDVLVADRLGERFICGDQLASIFFQAWKQQTHALRSFSDFVLGGQRRGILFQPLDAVKLFTDRQLRLRSAT